VELLEAQRHRDSEDEREEGEEEGEEEGSGRELGDEETPDGSVPLLSGGSDSGDYLHRLETATHSHTHTDTHTDTHNESTSQHYLRTSNFEAQEGTHDADPEDEMFLNADHASAHDDATAHIRLPATSVSDEEILSLRQQLSELTQQLKDERLANLQIVSAREEDIKKLQEAIAENMLLAAYLEESEKKGLVFAVHETFNLNLYF
jgi:hypothetical protein